MGPTLSLDDDGEYFCRVFCRAMRSGSCLMQKYIIASEILDRLSSVNRSVKKLESQFLSMQLHVGYLRSLEESERVRAACLLYLQTWFGCFFEARHGPGLQELERLAATFGGRLEAAEVIMEVSLD